MGVTHTLKGTLFAFESRCVLPRLTSNARNSRNLLTHGGDIWRGRFGGSALSQSGLHPFEISGQVRVLGRRHPNVGRRWLSRTTGGNHSGRHCKQSSKGREVVVERQRDNSEERCVNLITCACAGSEVCSDGVDRILQHLGREK